MPKRLGFLSLLLFCRFCARAGEWHSFIPPEDTNAVLHNPDMGWVVYENYPLDANPQGSSTLLTMPGDDFPEADAVALMFSWADVESEMDRYDFTNVDYAYDYWRSRGKEIQLRMSTEPLLIHVPGKPDASIGVPKYVLERLPPDQKQVRKMDGDPYTVVDARNSFYQQRLKKFLRAVDAHFDNNRPTTLIDLRGFGVWGEWHSGFRYPSLKAKHRNLSALLDLWSATLSKRALALSFSYDPDGPKELYAGPYDKFDAAFTTNYSQFLYYSAFDHALKKSNITFRRDGCGGAVHSNERRLNEQAFAKYHRAPMVSEFLGGYSAVQKGGSNWVTFMIEDALSLHPNYINLLGWQAGDARLFSQERPDLIALGLRRMGYRLVPTQVNCRRSPHHLEIQIDWVNRGAGRALKDYAVQLGVISKNGTIASTPRQTLSTSEWVKGKTYRTRHKISVNPDEAEKAQLFLKMTDPNSGREIKLPLKAHTESGYELRNLPI